MREKPLIGLEGSYYNEFTPELVTPDMAKTLTSWRLWSVGDVGPYFNALDAMVTSAEDRSGGMSIVLANPDINREGMFLEHKEPMSANHTVAQGLKAALTDAIGVGQYLLGYQHPDFPTSWAEIAPPRHGLIGRIAIKAATILDRRSHKPIWEIDKIFDVDIKELFTATTSVAWQYIDTFEVDTASLALVRMSGLPKDAKKKHQVYKDFERWSRRFDATAQELNPDQRLQTRRKIFHEIMSAAWDITAPTTLYSQTAEVKSLARVVKDYDAFTKATDPFVAELAELVIIYEQTR